MCFYSFFVRYQLVTFDFLVFLHELITDSKISKHPLHFSSELIPTLSLQLAYHRLFSLKTSAFLQQQSPAQSSSVEFLKDIFGLHVAENLDYFFDDLFYFLVCDACLATGFLQVQV